MKKKTKPTRTQKNICIHTQVTIHVVFTIKNKFNDQEEEEENEVREKEKEGEEDVEERKGGKALLSTRSLVVLKKRRRRKVFTGISLRDGEKRRKRREYRYTKEEEEKQNTQTHTCLYVEIKCIDFSSRRCIEHCSS